MNATNLDAAKELGLTGIKKYWRCTGQIKIELDWLHDWILVLIIFVMHSCKVYDNKEIGQNMSVKWNINSEWVSSFFVQLHGSI